MIRTFSRTVLAAVVAAVAVGTFGVAAQAGPAQDAPANTSAPETGAIDPAIDDLVGCVQGSRRLLVLMLIDESASLQESDPENRRVDAARSALDSLVALATTEGAASPSVQVSLAAFSNEYRMVQDWTPATGETAAGLNKALDGFAKYNHGIDTDFVNALSAGRESLADQAAVVTTDGGAAPCRAVLLFTDGGYDIAVRETPEDQEKLGLTKVYAPNIELTSKARVLEAEAAGRKALCDKGGVADRVRNDDITLLTVALSGSVARRSQLPLAAASYGVADGYTCGTQTERPQGAYLPASGIDVLVTRFNEVGTRLAGGNLLPGEDQVTICGQDPCDEGSRKFTLDSSLRRAQVLALAPKPGAPVTLRSPKGTLVRFTEAGTQDVGGTTVVARSVAGRGLILELARPADLEAWNGEWTTAITDPSKKQEGEPATLQVFVFSDISVDLGKTDPLERGLVSKIEARLEVPEGVKPEDVVATSKAEARFRNPVTGVIDTVAMDGPAIGPFTATYETPAETTVNALEVTIEVKMTTTTGAALVSQSSAAELPVRRPAGAIQFAPGSLKMPSLTGEGTTETELIIRGGAKDGCFWFGKVSIADPPEGVTVVELLQNGAPLPGQAECIKVNANGRTSLTIAATPDGRASGTVRGTVQLFERVDGVDKASTTDMQFRFDMARGVNQARRILLTIALLIAGLGIPMLALLIINAITARFQALDVVRGAAIPVQVSGKALSRIDAGYPRALVLKDEDFSSMAGRGTDRRFRFGGVEFRAQASRNPFSATIAMAAPEGGAEKLKGKAGSRVELDPGLAGSWVFLLDSDKTRRAPRGDAVGLLIAFVAEGDVKTQTNRMLPDIADRLPATASRLAGLVRQVKRKPPAKVKAGKHGGAANDLAPDAVDETDDELIESIGSGGGVVPSATADGELPDDAFEALIGGNDPTDDTDAASASTAPTEEASTVDSTANEAPPVAPTGFGGTARVAPTNTPVADPTPDDDGPTGPPIGFSGGRN